MEALTESFLSFQKAKVAPKKLSKNNFHWKPFFYNSIFFLHTNDLNESAIKSYTQ